MTIWLLKATLTPEEEARITERPYLTLPFGDLPDLSMISQPVALRHLLQALYPMDPPEAINRRVDRIWPVYSGLQPEDIIAVPLASRRELAIAEITAGYQYHVAEGGADVHCIAVKWHEKRVPFYALRRHPELLSAERPAISEIQNPQARTLIRDRLPHRYNRFAKWKWLLGLFFALGVLRLVVRLTGQ